MNTIVPPSAFTAPNWNGSVLTTEEKISSDMPLPMPRWVMSSPIHMRRAVPAVRVRTTSSTRGNVKSGSRTMFGTLRPKNDRPPPLPKRNVSAVACSRAIAMVR